LVFTDLSNKLMLQREYFYSNSNKGPIFYVAHISNEIGFQSADVPTLIIFLLFISSRSYQLAYVHVIGRNARVAIEITLRPILVNISTNFFLISKTKARQTTAHSTLYEFRFLICILQNSLVILSLCERAALVKFVR